jgi:hypothetical protein
LVQSGDQQVGIQALADANDLHSGASGGLDSGFGIFEDQALRGLKVQTARSLEKDLGIGFGGGHYVPVNQGVKKRNPAQAFQNERSIFRGGT